MESAHRGSIKITDRGRQVLEQSPPKITVNYLRQFKEFEEWRSAPKIDKGEQQGKEPTLVYKEVRKYSVKIMDYEEFKRVII